MSHNNTKLTWMPVTKETKPNQDGLGASDASYKEKYSSLKLQLKSILYENELYNSELIKLKRELIDIYSDKDTLLRRIVESGADLGTSDDEDSESQLSDILIPASCGDNPATIAAPASAPAAIDNDATSNVVISMPQIMATATTTTTSQAPIMTTDTNTASTNTTTTTTTDSRSKPKAASKPRAKPRPSANKASKAVGTTNDISITANNETNGLASKSNATNSKATTNTCAPVKQPAAKRKKQQPADQQQPTQAQQIELKINPLTEDQSVKATTKPPAPKRQRKPAQKKPPQPKKSPELPQQQLQLQLQPQQQQQQQQQIQQPQQKHQHLSQPQQQLQQQPMTVIGQVQVSLPNDHMKFVQHVNLPEQNLAGTNNLIVTNQATNSIQLHQNHDNNQQHHRIHFQLPQTTISTMDSFQTPQSVITTSQQGGHLNYGQHQSYTIVATNSNGNLIHHDLNQHHTNSPPVQITQLVPINQTMGQHLSNQAIQNQGMNQEINTIGFQQIQHHSNDHHNQQQQQQQQQQQHRQDETTNYEHQIVHFELPQIQLPQQQSHIPHSHRIHLQTQQQQVQQQRIQQSQNDPIAPDDLEQHLDGRRLEQAPLLMSDWESSVPSELFGSDSAIKFMAED